MPGITRFRIVGGTRGRGSWRFDDSNKMQPAANELYQSIFRDIGTPLETGYRPIECTKAEFQAGYDYALGIDVILKFANGQQATMQEKFLFTTFNTVTVEYMQDWRGDVKGDWFNMKCQYYFVGYANKDAGQFTNWLLLDWLRIMTATAQGRIPWNVRANSQDGARASFKHVHFDLVPGDCIIAVSHYYPWWCDPRPGPCSYCGNNTYRQDDRSSRYICDKCGLFYAKSEAGEL